MRAAGEKERLYPGVEELAGKTEVRAGAVRDDEKSTRALFQASTVVESLYFCFLHFLPQLYSVKMTQQEGVGWY